MLDRLIEAKTLQRFQSIISPHKRRRQYSCCLQLFFLVVSNQLFPLIKGDGRRRAISVMSICFQSIISPHKRRQAPAPSVQTQAKPTALFPINYFPS